MPGFVLFLAFIPIIAVITIVMSLDKGDESVKETHVFNPGDIGFVNTPEGLDECRIEGIWPDCDPDHIVYQVQSLISGGSYGAYAEKIFAVRENAIEASNGGSNRLIQKYCEQIETIEDLIAFPLEHNLVGEYADYEAVHAYKIRSKELANVDVEDK